MHRGERGCIYTEASMRPLWARNGGDVARCIRHGALITYEKDFASKAEARAWADGEQDVSTWTAGQGY